MNNNSITDTSSTPAVFEPIPSPTPLPTDVPSQPATPSDNHLPRLAYSVKEAAEILGVSDKTVRRLVDRGLLKPSRAIRHLLIPIKELRRFLDETTVK